MSGKNIIFNDEKINKSNVNKNKKLSKIDKIYVDKILLSKKETYSTKNLLKYFIGYNDNGVIRPCFIKLPQMIGYVKHFDSNKTMSFKVTIDNKLLKKCTKIRERVSSLMNIKSDGEPVYGNSDKYTKTKIKSYRDKINKYTKTKIKSYRDKINTNFHGKKIPKEGASDKCLSLIILDSVIIVNKKYYPQTLLEECKYTIKKNGESY